MASNKIKGLTVEIGGDTTKLGKALDNVNKQSSGLSSELRDINKLLKLDPGNTELLAQKQKVLADEIATTSEKLDILKEAERQVQQQFEKGEATEEQVRELQREIIKTTQALDRFEKEAKDLKDELDGVGDEADDAGDKTEDFADASEKADKAGGGLASTLSKGVAVGLAAVVAGVTAAATALYNSVEATQEYRTAMGKLNTAFEVNNHSSEAARKTYEELQGILGETDQAVEASNFLAALADSEEDLAKWTDICTGVYAQFGDGLPIEGLAEAANETAKVGQVTGPLADAINWASVSTEGWSAALDGHKEAQTAFNAALKEGEAVEDAFNAALAECSDEQERQQLIMEAMSDVYSETAEVYRETNAEVIRSNKATEKLNKAWAKVGEKAAPVVNTFRECVADLAEELVDMVDEADIEDFQKSIKKGFSSLARDVIPKLINALKWCIDHFDEIKSVAVGFIAALAVGKIASFATAIGSTLVSAFKTLTTSLKGATTAQKGMNVAASVNPYVALTQVVIGLGAALYSYFGNSAKEARLRARELTLEMYGLTEAEKETIAKTNETAEAFKNQRESLDKSREGTVAQMDYVSKLAGELRTLADSTGKVEDKDRSRAEFILNELNQALGTEYTLTGNLIQNYKDFAASIDTVIEKKKAELLLADSVGAYTEALKNKTAEEQNSVNLLDTYLDKRAAYNIKVAELEAAQTEQERIGTFSRKSMKYYEAKEAVKAKQEEVNAIKGEMDKANTAYTNSQTVIAGYYTDLGQYETAQILALEGNTAEAAKVLADREYYIQHYADSVGFAHDEIINTWEQEAIQAGLKAELIRKNWENGVEGYTEEMVTEAETNYQKALDAMGTAYDDALAVGGDVSNGLGDGMEGGRLGLIDKAKSLVKSIMGAFRKEADSHSPSRKMIAFGEDMGEGAVIGLDNKTGDLVDTAKTQVHDLMGAFDSSLQRAQSTMRGSVHFEQAAEGKLRTTHTETTTAGLTDTEVLKKLDELNARIGRMKWVTNTGALVGELIDDIDVQLSGRQRLVARGAR